MYMGKMSNEQLLVFAKEFWMNTQSSSHILMAGMRVKTGWKMLF